jgi:hypothetical protein
MCPLEMPLDRYAVAGHTGHFMPLCASGAAGKVEDWILISNLR